MVCTPLVQISRIDGQKDEIRLLFQGNLKPEVVRSGLCVRVGGSHHFLHSSRNRALAGKLVRFQQEIFSESQRICTRIVETDRFRVTSWYTFSGILKTFLVESDKFSRKRSINLDVLLFPRQSGCEPRAAGSQQTHTPCVSVSETVRPEAS